MSRWLLKDTQIIPKCHVQRKPYHAELPAVGSIPTLPGQRGEGCFGRNSAWLLHWAWPMSAAQTSLQR